MSSIGIIKEFDKLGRIVIPKDLRERYGLKNTVEIVATKEGILLRSQEYRLERKITTHKKQKLHLARSAKNSMPNAVFYVIIFLYACPKPLR